jgi:hypothetical protein
VLADIGTLGTVIHCCVTGLATDVAVDIVSRVAALVSRMGEHVASGALFKWDEMGSKMHS